jgi:hypothetical protein
LTRGRSAVEGVAGKVKTVATDICRQVKLA